MALTRADVAMWTDLRRRGLVPHAPRVLEIGQANWFGDIDPPAGCRPDAPFETARQFYRDVLSYREIIAVDWHGPDALRLDLNEPLPLEGTFEVVINTGTAEHVFDQRRLFQSVHELCSVGGLMVHAAPWQGWLDHGLYCYQPCFFSALGRANDYEGVYRCAFAMGPAGAAGKDIMLYVVLRKTRATPFRVPVQGKYRGR